MGKVLEKSLMDAQKEDRLVLGQKQVRAAASASKLIVISRSAGGNAFAEEITAAAAENSVPLVRFGGTSVALGRMCGLQFRASAVSFSSLEETSVNSIIKESDSEGAGVGTGREKR